MLFPLKSVSGWKQAL